VASQTLTNITRVDEVAGMPMLRPLIGMDKLEITAEAQRLGTFEISIEPDADCCTLFTPRHPATRVSAEEITAAERGLDIPRLVAMALEGTRLERFEFPGEDRATDRDILFA
jgi:thiamine biosynthesis protein ThiI